MPPFNPFQSMDPRLGVMPQMRDMQQVPQPLQALPQAMQGPIPGPGIGVQFGQLLQNPEFMKMMQGFLGGGGQQPLDNDGLGNVPQGQRLARALVGTLGNGGIGHVPQGQQQITPPMAPQFHQFPQMQPLPGLIR
jgi:hypothetical protein